MFRIAKYSMGAAAALLAVGLAACDDDQGPSDEPQFTTTGGAVARAHTGALAEGHSCAPSAG